MWPYNLGHGTPWIHSSRAPHHRVVMGTIIHPDPCRPCRQRITWAQSPRPALHRHNHLGKLSPRPTMDPRVDHRIGPTSRAQNLDAESPRRHTPYSPDRCDALTSIPCACPRRAGRRRSCVIVAPYSRRRIPPLSRNLGLVYVPQAVGQPVPSRLTSELRHPTDRNELALYRLPHLA